MMEQHTKSLEQQCDELRQDLTDARNGWESATAQLNEVCAQRDELLAILIEIQDYQEYDGLELGPRIDAAIAKASKSC